MSEQPMRERLGTLRTTHAVGQAKLNRQHAANESRQQEIEAQIQRLQAEREELMVTNEQLERERATAGRNVLEAEVAIILEELEASAHALRGLGELLYQRAQVDEYHRELLAKHPEWEAQLVDYRRYIADPTAVLETVPEWHRPAMQQSYTQLGQELAPLIQVEASKQTLPPLHQLTLAIGVTANLDALKIQWIIPVRTAEARLDGVQPLSGWLIHILRNAICGTDPQSGWDVADLVVSSWQDYVVLEALGEYHGPLTIDDASEALIQAAIMTSEHLKDVPLTISVAELSIALWQHQIVPQEELLPEKEPASPSGAISTLLSQLFAAQGTDAWYSATDVQSWERPLKVSKTSLWTAQARRLRTLLMRMVARGYIGGDGVLLEQLHSHVPEPHATDLQRGIGQLLTNEILIFVPNGSVGQAYVTINPECMAEVQALINRDIMPGTFWSDMLKA